ncbi:hypothetical protein BSL78_25143 [Apostichopus japonicus]|uniref:C2H2-type domain-containing protein n=1 Tax=Stichopus japonicus TaxID=307972 RepID=A0A2G8JQH6_STIJA|nr:hypothetical protein BSL78_25143 [Apostichopus japonicus]
MRFLCKICNKEFNRHFNLRRHESIIHASNQKAGMITDSEDDTDGVNGKERYVNTRRVGVKYKHRESDSTDDRSEEDNDLVDTEGSNEHNSSDEPIETSDGTGSSGSEDDDGDDHDDEDGERTYDAVETWMHLLELNKAMSKILHHGLKNKDESDKEEEGDNVYDAVETWMTLIQLNKAMTKVLRHGLKNKYESDDDEEEDDNDV